MIQVVRGSAIEADKHANIDLRLLSTGIQYVFVYTHTTPTHYSVSCVTRPAILLDFIQSRH